MPTSAGNLEPTHPDQVLGRGMQAHAPIGTWAYESSLYRQIVVPVVKIAYGEREPGRVPRVAPQGEAQHTRAPAI